MSQQLLLTRGDDRTLTLTVPSPMDLTTATSLRFTAKSAYTDPDTQAVFAKAVGTGITIQSAGTALIAIDDSDWDDTHYPDPLVFDVEVVDASAKVTTLVSGTIKVQDDVTRDAP